MFYFKVFPTARSSKESDAICEASHTSRRNTKCHEPNRAVELTRNEKFLTLTSHKKPKKKIAQNFPDFSPRRLQNVEVATANGCYEILHLIAKPILTSFIKYLFFFSILNFVCLLFLIHQLLSVRTAIGDCHQQLTWRPDDQPRCRAPINQMHETKFFCFSFSFFILPQLSNQQSKPNSISSSIFQSCCYRLGGAKSLLTHTHKTLSLSKKSLS